MCFPLDSLDSRSFCIWDAPSSIITQQKYAMDSDIPLTISAVVTTHWPSVGIWHWAWAASYVKPLDFWASTGQCVLCTCIWLFCFPRPIADWFPASPLVSLRGSDEHGINLFFSFLTPIKLKNQYSFTKHKGSTRKKCFHVGRVYSSPHHHLRHMRPLPNSNDSTPGKIWVFLQSSSKIDQCLQMKPPPKASAWGFAQYRVRKKAFQARPLISPTHFQEFCSYKITAPGRRTLHCTEKWLD